MECKMARGDIMEMEERLEDRKNGKLQTSGRVMETISGGGGGDKPGSSSSSFSV